MQEVLAERDRQDTTWGADRDIPDGTGGVFESARNQYRGDCDEAFRDGSLTWRHILREEVYEALAEEVTHKLRAELIQVAAVALAWLEALDRPPSQQ